MKFAILAFVAGALLLPGCSVPLSPEETVVINIRYSKFLPDRVHVPIGKTVKFVIQNQDPIDHEFIVGGEEVHVRHKKGTEPAHGEVPGEVTIEAGETASTTFVFSSPGEWLFACHLPQHFRYGMKGFAVVES